MAQNWVRIDLIEENSLFSLVVEKNVSGKNQIEVVFFMKRVAFHKLWIVVSYLVFGTASEWCSAKLSVLQKAVLYFVLKRSCSAWNEC